VPRAKGTFRFGLEKFHVQCLLVTQFADLFGSLTPTPLNLEKVSVCTKLY
jgi:hypothetical protein